MTVYVIRRNGDPSGNVKIGLAKDLQKRLASMRTSSPEGFCVLHELPGDIALERTLHKVFADYRVSGEWFALSPEQISAIPMIRAEKSLAPPERLFPTSEDEEHADIVRAVRFYLNELVKNEWRGMGDNAEDARNRVVDRCQIDRSYGFRLWNKPAEMSDVSGEAYRCIRLAYVMMMRERGLLNETQASYLRGLVRYYRDTPEIQNRSGFGTEFILSLIPEFFPVEESQASSVGTVSAGVAKGSPASGEFADRAKGAMK